jgi:diacylglycerol kinase family enzyme
VAQGNSNTKHLFILNPKSFWHEWKQTQVLSRIHGFFNNADNNNYDVHISRFPRDAAGFIPLYAKDLPDDTTLRVYAIGGDGILFVCLNGIMGIANAELAVIPYGRTNNFIRGFGKYEKTFFRNIGRQVGAPAIPLDVMRCGNNYALSNCVIGLEAEAVRHSDRIRNKMNPDNSLSQWLCRRLYALHYLTGGFAAGFDRRRLRRQYEIEIDGKKYSDYYWGFSMFNSPYYGGKWHPSNTAMPNDGILDIFFLRGKRFLKTYSLFPFYLSGHYKILPRTVIPAQGQKITIRSGDILKISMDDCTFYESELDVELLPAKIRFIDASRHGCRGVSND